MYLCGRQLTVWDRLSKAKMEAAAIHVLKKALAGLLKEIHCANTKS